jgi:hypothetical protein
MKHLILSFCRNQEGRSNGRQFGSGAAGGRSGVLGNGTSLLFNQQCDGPVAEAKQKNLPCYTMEEVAARNGPNGAETWVTRRGKVYNITEYLSEQKG